MQHSPKNIYVLLFWEALRNVDPGYTLLNVSGKVFLAIERCVTFECCFALLNNGEIT